MTTSAFIVTDLPPSRARELTILQTEDAILLDATVVQHLLPRADWRWPAVSSQLGGCLGLLLGRARTQESPQGGESEVAGFAQRAGACWRITHDEERCVHAAHRRAPNRFPCFRMQNWPRKGNLLQADGRRMLFGSPAGCVKRYRAVFFLPGGNSQRHFTQ